MEQPSETLQDYVAGIYESMRENVFRYLLVLGLPPERAQEICQETFLRLYGRLRDGEKIETVAAWVFTVARNCGLDARRRERQFAPLGEEMESLARATGPDPEQQYLEEERRRCLLRAMRTLSPQQRHCLHLRAEGLRYREIAEVVGIRTSTVGEFLRRGIARLREAL